MAEEQGTQNGRVEVTEQERAARIAERTEHYRRELAQDGYVQTTPGHWERQEGITTASPERAAAFVNGSADRAVADHAAEQQWREQQRPAFEAAARAGAWAPDWVGAGVSGSAAERSVQDLKPVAQMSNQEIVSEVRGAHEQFQKLSEEFATASADRRAELRQEMQPLVNRERELRAEFTGRLSPELTQDRVPEQQIAFSR